MNNVKSFFKKFPDEHEALVVRTSVNYDPAALAEVLNLPQANGLLLLSGGAGFMPAEMFNRLSNLFNILAEILVQLKITVMDGGTDSGVMSLMGKALYNNGRKAPHIGILPAYAEVEPGGPLAEEILEPHHSHFILVDSDEWGSEVEIMNNLATHISKNRPSLALLVNGGAIALKDIEGSIKNGRELIVIKGSGRLADEIAEAKLYPDQEAREPIKAVVRKGRLIIYDLFDPIERLTRIFNHHFKGEYPE